MITLYAGALRYLGLSQSEAADLHGVRVDTVKSWCSGRRSTPEDIWKPLRRFAFAREALITQHRPLSRDDAAALLSTMENTGADFPTADSYVTMLAAAVLTSDDDAAHP